jgi:glycosidase
MPIAWDMAERRPQVAPYYRALAALRRAHPAFTRGTVRWLRNGDESRVLSWERNGAGESVVVALNLSSLPFVGLIEVPAGEYRDITPGDVTPDRAKNRSGASPPAVFLAPWEFRVFRRVSP